MLIRRLGRSARSFLFRGKERSRHSHEINLYYALLSAIREKKWDDVFRLLDVAEIDVNPTSTCDLSPIVEASCSGSLALIQKLVSVGANPHHREVESGATALSQACLAGNVEVVEYLLVHCGCDPNIANARGFTPLHNACLHRHYSVVALLLDHGANIHARRNYYGQTPLHFAAEKGNQKLIQLLLDRSSASLEEVTIHDQTALHLAVGRWCNPAAASLDDDQTSAVVRELLDRRANVSCQDRNRQTPLDRALCFQRMDVSAMLLKAYRDQLLLTTRENHNNCLAFHTIIRQLVVVDCFKNRHFQAHAPLHPFRVQLAVGTLTMGLFRTLIESFDNSNELIRSRDNNDNGALPIHVACVLGVKVDILRILVELDPSTLRLPNATGALPIHLLCGNGQPDMECLQYLVEKGGIVTLRTRDRNGALPLHHLLGRAGTINRRDSLKRMVVFLLEAHPAALSVATHDGDVPIMVASEASCSEDILFLLMKACPTALISM